MRSESADCFFFYIYYDSQLSLGVGLPNPSFIFFYITTITIYHFTGHCLVFAMSLFFFVCICDWIKVHANPWLFSVLEVFHFYTYIFIYYIHLPFRILLVSILVLFPAAKLILWGLSFKYLFKYHCKWLFICFHLNLPRHKGCTTRGVVFGYEWWWCFFMMVVVLAGSNMIYLKGGDQILSLHY